MYFASSNMFGIAWKHSLAPSFHLAISFTFILHIISIRHALRVVQAYLAWSILHTSPGGMIA